MSRINHQPAFLLASTPWRENSLRLEVFSRDYGRVALLARSARTRGSELRGILTPFVPISLSWYGKEDLKTLHRAEWLGGWAQPQQGKLLSAHYLNELLLKFSAPEDPLPALYHDFAQAQCDLANQQHTGITLRHFEWYLLTHLGLAPSAQFDESGQAIREDGHYFIQAECAARPCHADFVAENGVTVSGSLLLQLHQRTLSAHSPLAQAFALTRLLIDHHAPAPLYSRQILPQLQKMKSLFTRTMADVEAG